MSSGLRRSIYLCFNEWNSDVGAFHRNHIVRRIGIGLETSTADGNGVEDLPVIANKVSSSKDSYPTRFTTFSSKIVFPLKETRGICWFDSSKCKPKLEVSSPTNCKIRSFDQPKHRVHLGEVDGKLYAISVDPFSKVTYPHPDYVHSVGNDLNTKLFEVFDPRSLQWRHLARPHFVYGQYVCRFPNSIWRESPGLGYRSFHHYETKFLDESKKILGWISGEACVWCFDTTNLENKWTKLDNPCLLNTIPFASESLFIHTRHPDFGDFYLVFTYKPLEKPLFVYPYIMSNTCDSFQPIEQSISLPELCDGYINSKYETYEDDNVYSCQFLHLGDQKVGLIINTFGEGHGHVLLVTFEYNVKITVEDSKPKIGIQTHLLGTRRFKYHTMDLPGDSGYDKVNNTRLDGAFFL